MSHQPDHPRALFGIRFSLLARRWRRFLDARLTAVGLTDATWIPLVHLHRTGGGISQKELATLVGVDSSSLVRVLDILERRNLIDRRRDSRDGRLRLIFLSQEGKSHVEQIRREVAAAEEAILMPLDDGELAVLLDAIDRLDRQLDGLAADDTKGW